MSLDFSRCKLPPFVHQREDTEWLVEQLYAFIASEMRTGKTKIVIDAAQFLYTAGKINQVIVVTPAPVRDVWADKQFGEIRKHLWDGIHATVTEYHARTRTWTTGGTEDPSLDFYVTNFEFLRAPTRLNELFKVCGPKTLLVGDESSFLKNYAAQQTRAFNALRLKCGRVVLLNGTPIFHSPLDLFSQGNILHPSILDCKFITKFKAKYAVQSPVLGLGGKPLTTNWGTVIKQIDGWVNLDDLERRFKPHTRRRLQSECLDLPPKLDPVTMTATLTTKTWRTYKTMRDELVVWLSNGNVAIASTAAIKALRLSQITGGFLSGVECAGVDDAGISIEPGLLESLDYGDGNGRNNSVAGETIGRDARDAEEDPSGIEGYQRADSDGSESSIDIVGTEKLDVLLWFIGERLEPDPNLHLVVWSRFRNEAFRAYDAIREKFPQFQTGLLLGGQSRADRTRALSLLKPETSPVGPVCVVGIEGTGSFGIDMCAAHTCVTLSSGYSPGKSAQTLDRVYGPGQKYPIAYYNIVAVGPRGQKTIDHDILTARQTGENIAQRTAAAWVEVLKRE